MKEQPLNQNKISYYANREPPENRKKKVIVFVKNLFGFDGVTGSDKDGERCRRKERFSKSVKAGLQFPVGRISCSSKKDSCAIRCVDLDHLVLLYNLPTVLEFTERNKVEDSLNEISYEEWGVGVNYDN
ncbi:hypothetical protein IGI04_006870 [Brassica rapa subsp. trilocularis]|uniref:Uncharacterized protein n=1 Tax=Brassica rapa subsp. trilocularis TaxID=1813537 RepID=A0ABQ7NI37_BRACM|nr:hypothetical protein IGI04_006870 [Brassica rapa subsp. trilocularis]